MAKTWEQMTQSEKIEDLRSDIKRIMESINGLSEQQRRLGEFHHDLMTKHSATSNLASEVAGEVRVLEEKIAKLRQ